MKIFKERLITLRKLNNFTQTRVANYLGIAQASYIRYEKGTSEPTLANLVKLADLLDVSVDYLLGREKFISDKISGVCIYKE